MEIDKVHKGDLDLGATQITELPKGLTVGGSLDLEGSQIVELPKGLKVGSYLNLEGSQITELPKDLKVGGALYLRGSQITNYPVVYNCGHEGRAIYLDLMDKSKIRIGCFIGTKSEALEAIIQKYGDAEYAQQVRDCFKLGETLCK